jgi:hypothetical protein
MTRWSGVGMPVYRSLLSVNREVLVPSRVPLTDETADRLPKGKPREGLTDEGGRAGR